MKLPNNNIKTIIHYIYTELNDFYPKEEVKSFSHLLFEHYFGFSKTDLLLKTDEKVSESELLKFHFAIKDLKKYKPIQYILGETQFYGLKIKVNEHVLIPRPETEELVEWLISKTSFNLSKEKKKYILDIGTGSGCIAIALKKHLKNVTVDAIDISKKALEVSKENAVLNNAEINFEIHDIFNLKEVSSWQLAVSNPQSAIRNPQLAPLITHHSPLTNYDIIVSNPPYVLEKEKIKMEKNVTGYEPEQALFVKDDEPLLFYNAIAEFALKHLNKNGKLYLEINEEFGEETKQLFKDKGFNNIALNKDLSEKDRMICCSLI